MRMPSGSALLDGDNGELIDDPLLEELREQMMGTHPLMGMMFEVFEERGHREMLADYADTNPTGFVKAMLSFIPSVQPVSAVQGDVKLVVHHTLEPTALDVLDEQ